MPDADEANENLLILQNKFFGSVRVSVRMAEEEDKKSDSGLSHK